MPPTVRTTLWVCCNCKWTSNAATSVQCVNCDHGFGTGHCTQETHDLPAGR